MHELEAWGFDSFFSQQLQLRDERLLVGRVRRAHRERYELVSAVGSYPATLSGRFRQEGREWPAVGDWVLFRRPTSSTASGVDQHTECVAIQSLLERRNALSRGAAGRVAEAQVIAANVDKVFVLCGLDADFNIRRIERYLSRIAASEAEGVVVLSKRDLCAEPLAKQVQVQRRCPDAEVITYSAVEEDGLDELLELLVPTQTVALVGSSGAGKSTLVNRLLGEARMRTQALRDDKGVHTTTHKELLMLPNGSILVDTPGMRELALLDDEGLSAVFSDIESLAVQCRFTDCQHIDEPGCAVLAAVEDGELDAERLEHYQKLIREAQAYALRHDEHRRRQAERVWGQLSDEVAMLRRWKGGKA